VYWDETETHWQNSVYIQYHLYHPKLYSSKNEQLSDYRNCLASRAKLPYPVLAKM